MKKKMDKSTWVIVVFFALCAAASLLPNSELVSIEETQSLQSWIGLAIGAATSIAGGAIGASQANKQAKKAEQALAAGQAQLDSWYNNIMNTNILDRADTQAMLKAYRDAQEEQAKKYQTNAIKGGASEEAKIAYAQAQNKGYADAISKIAAQGQAVKDQAAQTYMQGKMNYYNQLADRYMNAGQATSNAFSSAFNSLGSIFSGLGK